MRDATYYVLTAVKNNTTKCTFHRKSAKFAEIKYKTVHIYTFVYIVCRYSIRIYAHMHVSNKIDSSKSLRKSKKLCMAFILFSFDSF